MRRRKYEAPELTVREAGSESLGRPATDDLIADAEAINQMRDREAKDRERIRRRRLENRAERDTEITVPLQEWRMVRQTIGSVIGALDEIREYAKERSGQLDKLWSRMNELEQKAVDARIKELVVEEEAMERDL